MNEESLLKKNSVAEKNEISLKDIFRGTKSLVNYIKARWVTLIIAAGIGGVLGSVYFVVKKPVYTAVSTFVLEESGKPSGLGQYAGLASMVGLDLGDGGGGLFQSDNILELYKSRTMLQKVLLSSADFDGQKHMLIDYYINFNGLRKKWEKNEKLRDINFNLKPGETYTRLQDSVIGSIISDINKRILLVNKPDKKLSIFNVEVKSTDESFSKIFNDQIVKHVNDFYVQTKTRKSLDNIIILQQQTDSVRNVLNNAIYTGAATIDATPNLNPTKQVLRAPIQRSQFNAEANKAILTQLVQNLELSKIALRKETPLIQVIDVPVYPLLKNKLTLPASIVTGIFLGLILCVFYLTSKKFFNENL